MPPHVEKVMYSQAKYTLTTVLAIWNFEYPATEVASRAANDTQAKESYSSHGKEKGKNAFFLHYA